MQLTRPDCDCGYLGASFRAINRPIAVDIGRADYSFADSRRADIAEISRIVSRTVLQVEKIEMDSCIFGGSKESHPLFLSLSLSLSLYFSRRVVNGLA
jgi:hypothetical protein